MERKKNAACYVRVSTEEQHRYGISVDAQIAVLTEYCEQNGLNPVIFNDAGYSARKSYKTRPALNEMMKACASGKIDVILFTKLDRLTRSVGDYYAISEGCNGVPWRALQEDYETQTPGGILKVNIMLSVSQNEADQTSQRIKSTFDFKRAKGEPCSGAVPVGYRIRDKRLEFDPETQEAVNSFFREYLATLSLDAAIASAKAHGLTSCRTTWDKRLRNPVYRGVASYGNVPAYISEAEYETIDRNMRKRTRRTGKHDRLYIFAGLCRCGTCGLNLPGRSARCEGPDRNGVMYEYSYYTCCARPGRLDKMKACKGVYVNEAKLEKKMLDELDAYLSDYEIRIKNTPNKKADEKRKARLEEKLKRLRELYLDLEISKDDYDSRRLAIQSELSSIRPTVRSSKPELPTNWRELYESMSAESKRSFWRRIVSNITVYSRKEIAVAWL